MQNQISGHKCYQSADGSFSLGGRIRWEETFHWQFCKPPTKYSILQSPVWGRILCKMGELYHRIIGELRQLGATNPLLLWFLGLQWNKSNQALFPNHWLEKFPHFSLRPWNLLATTKGVGTHIRRPTEKEKVFQSRFQRLPSMNHYFHFLVQQACCAKAATKTSFELSPIVEHSKSANFVTADRVFSTKTVYQELPQTFERGTSRATAVWWNPQRPATAVRPDNLGSVHRDRYTPRVLPRNSTMSLNAF